MPRIIENSALNITGKKIKEFREAKNWSQQQLSAKLETLAVYVCRGSISRIEAGNRTVTDIELAGFSQVLCIPIEEFFS